MFSTCLCLWWFCPKDRWVSFYRDWTFEYTTNFNIPYEREYTDFIRTTLHVSCIVTIIRMVAVHILIGGLVLDQIKLMMPFLLWNLGSIIFSCLLLISLIFVNDHSDLGSEEFADHNVKFVAFTSILLAYQVAFEVCGTKRAREIYHERRIVIQFQTDINAWNPGFFLPARLEYMRNCKLVIFLVDRIFTFSMASPEYSSSHSLGQKKDVWVPCIGFHRNCYPFVEFCYEGRICIIKIWLLLLLLLIATLSMLVMLLFAHYVLKRRGSLIWSAIITLSIVCFLLFVAVLINLVTRNTDEVLMSPSQDLNSIYHVSGRH